ncbi:glycosyltransferase family 39 protein [Nonomuraea sp. 3-1Str]|uniref:glycosyltransferase family 39 protein n=1 Tax=Nonomuraea sp. 3-1Str TaxID=2929801 RepID=UPI00285C610D|nr:glycosyltransferase family 39 protein [Nonomuraea sp. 3-1Str]MDR8408830.1 glycosyltransferase family 39 protein [Nonomuraea sp. 3-1Str]
MTTTHARTRWAPAGLLAATAALYLWGLGSSGWANSFYSAAVQAGSQSWKAFFFGSSDAANAITVDKTPASLWPMELSARLFGLNSWSILVPQALMGVATVAVVYATVRRRFPVWAGLLAGAVMALTPVAVLMFRFNNPDALLVLLLTLAAYCVVRAQERAVTRWLVLAGVCLGFAFLAKMLQAFLVLPGFALVYVMMAPTKVWRRVRQLALAGVAMVVSAGWWLLAVALVPASERPYIGGSQTNSVLELALGYNGIGRLNGADYGGLGNLNQEAGPLRLFDTEAGGQISWLLPAALILLAAAPWLTRGAFRTDRARAQFGVWGGWLAVTGLVFSLMQGIFHAYYTVALAPAIAGLVGAGAALLWERREPFLPAAVTGVTALWSYVLLTRDGDWNPWLGPAVLVAGLGLAVALPAGSRFTARRRAPDPEAKALEPVRRRMPRWWGAVVAGAIAVCLAGPAAYAVDTAASPHTGAIPTAGPSTGGLGPGGFRGGRALGMSPTGPQPGTGRPGGAPPQGMGRGAGRDGVGGGMGGRAGGMGGLLDAPAPSAELTTLLKSGAAAYTWAAATVGSNNAAGYQLATGLPVMAVGGFNGTDPAPTLPRFQRYVAEKKIHYFVGSGMGTGGRAGASGSGGSDEAARIGAWVQETFTATTVGGVTVFDLTAR